MFERYFEIYEAVIADAADRARPSLRRVAGGRA